MDPNELSKKLFSEFPAVTTVEWEAKIQADLKGADYDKKLLWRTEEGFTVKPYYREEDLKTCENGVQQLIGKIKGAGNSWIIREDIPASDIDIANKLAREAITKGVGALGLNAMLVSTHKEMHQLLDGIDLEKIQIHFTSSRSYPLTFELFHYEINSRGIDHAQVKCSLNFDLIGYLLVRGEFYQSLEANLEEAVYLVQVVSKKFPAMKAITINGQLFGNAGSTIVQELAFTLASANEYLADLTQKELSVDTIAQHMMLSYSVGSNYFFEIAKIRAARLLWANLIDRYQPADPASRDVFIHCSTSLWNKTIFDPYVNMLRTTTEGMSAALGSADSITVTPFSSPYAPVDEFSSRIARNQQLVLKEEAYLDKVVDPAAGSYYIETLTDSIAVQAWELFKSIEEKGGMIECIKSGYIQEEVEKSNDRKVAEIAQRKTVMIGTNQYPNLQEMMLEHISSADVPTDEKESTYRKLKKTRGALVIENIRLLTERFVEQGHKKPSVFLLTIGNLAMRKARATFATNFFGCAGFAIIDNPGFTTAGEGVHTAVQSGAEIVVICSSDDEYPAIVPEVCEGLKALAPKTKRVLAGYPKDLVETFNAAGIEEYIHVRSDLVQTLKKFQEGMGVSGTIEQ